MRYNYIYITFVLIIILFVFLYIVNNQKYIEIENFDNNDQYTAVIIEPREHPALETVLQNFTRNLDTRWNFIIFHGNKNQDYIQEIMNNSLSKEIDRIKLINLKVDNLTIDEYNKLLLYPRFYEYIPTETFLIFQTDSLICDKHKDLIYDFMDYDYVGAPWSFNGDVGNGGLSLRKKSKMLQIIKENSVGENEPEDVYFSKYTENKPDFNEAKYFSIESVESDKTFGMHKAWDVIPNNKISEFCLDYNKVKMLNKK